MDTEKEHAIVSLWTLANMGRLEKLISLRRLRYNMHLIQSFPQDKVDYFLDDTWTRQCWKLSNIFKYHFDVLVLYLSKSILSHFTHLPHYISEANIVHFNPQYFKLLHRLRFT